MKPPDRGNKISKPISDRTATQESYKHPGTTDLVIPPSASNSFKKQKVSDLPKISSLTLEISISEADLNTGICDSARTLSNSNNSNGGGRFISNHLKSALDQQHRELNRP